VELRVATYNIKAGSGADNVLDPDRTAAAIAETGADGSNGYRLRAWKTELATLGAETGLRGRKEITCTYPVWGVMVVLCRLPWMSKSRWRRSSPRCSRILMSVSDG